MIGGMSGALHCPQCNGIWVEREAIQDETLAAQKVATRQAIKATAGIPIKVYREAFKQLLNGKFMDHWLARFKNRD